MRGKTRDALGILTASLIAATSAAAQQPPAPPGFATITARLQALDAVPDTKGSGPYPALKEQVIPRDGLDLVVYRPADLSALGGRKLGVHVWGNGGCSGNGAGSRFHLLDIASYEYVSIAPGRIESRTGAQAPAGSPRGSGVTAEKMLAALDWILAENARAGSPFYQRIDAAKIAASGYSCGGLLALRVGQDPRVKTVILQNSGVLPSTGPAPPLGGLTKDDLARLRTPILYILGGPDDVAQPHGLDDFQRIDRVPVFVADRRNAGHIGVFNEPAGRGTEIEIDWLRWQLENDARAGRTFTGEDCRLCYEPGWTVHRKGIR